MKQTHVLIAAVAAFIVLGLLMTVTVKRSAAQEQLTQRKQLLLQRMANLEQKLSGAAGGEVVAATLPSPASSPPVETLAPAPAPVVASFAGERYLTYEFKTIMPGFTLQKRHLIDMLLLAERLNRTLIPVPFAARHDDVKQLVPFEALFAPDASLRVAAAVPEGLARVTGTRLPVDGVEAPSGAQWLHLPASVVGPSIGVVPLRSFRDRQVRRRIVEGLRPAAALQRAAEAAQRALRGRTGRRSYACLHHRFEPDAQGYFRGPPQIYNGSLTARLLAREPLVTAQPVLYVAGAHSRAALAPFRRRFRRVATKRSLLPADHPLWQQPYVFAAALDFEVCRHANVVVGNRFSTWSELLCDWLFYEGRSGQCLQINNGEHGRLQPFCSSNNLAYLGVPCAPPLSLADPEQCARNATAFYLKMNPDVVGVMEARQHFNVYGRHENRISCWW